MSLLDSLIASGARIENIAEDWLREYQTDPRESFIEVVSLIFQTCGITQSVPHSVFETGWVNFLKVLERALPASALSTYPLVDKRENLGKHISKVVCNFFGTIISRADEDVLYDGFFFNELCQFLYVLTNSSLRAFRHTATLIVVKMVTHMSQIAKSLTLQYSRIERQLSSSIGEQSIERSSARRESLENLSSALGSKISELEEKIYFFIKTCLPERFRDVLSSIRLICLEELEIWLLKYPNVFMGHRNLKYLGWALSDQYVAMRQKSIQVLKKIYSDNELAKNGEMDLFTLKFKLRIITMSLDKSIQVSTIAIQVISAIYRVQPDIFTKADLEYIFYLAYSEHIEVANEVAGFIHQVIGFILKDKPTSGMRQGSLSLLELKNIVLFTKSLEKIPLLVNAMLCQPNAKYMYKWEYYIEILLYSENFLDRNDQEDDLDLSLDIEDESIIVSFMANSAKQVFLYENPRSLQKSKKIAGLKSIWNDEVYYDSSIKLFIKYLPTMMRKYMPHGDIIGDLLSLCLVVDVKKAENQDIQTLLTSLLEVSEKNVNTDIHLACDKAIAHLSKGRSTMAKFVSANFMDPYLQEIVSSWEESLRVYSKKCSELEQFTDIIEEEDLIFKLETNSDRLFVASCHFGLKEILDWETLIALCKGFFVDGNGRSHPITTMVMRNSLKTALTYILHDLPIKNVEENDLLKYRIDDYLQAGKFILKSIKDIDHTVRITALHCISEMMCIICQAPTSVSDLWKEMIESIGYIIIENTAALIHRDEGFDELAEDEELDLIQTYCSLILRGGLPPVASIIFLKNINSQMVVSMWSRIEITLSTIISWNVEEFSMIILYCLTNYYDEILEKEGEDLLGSQKYGEFKLVTERIYKQFGPKMREDTKASLKFHLKGIGFATIPNKEEMLPRIHFVRVLILFAPVINPKFRRKLLDYLAEHKSSLKEKLPSVPEELINNMPMFEEYEKILSSSDWSDKPKQAISKRKRKANATQKIPLEDVSRMELEDED